MAACTCVIPDDVQRWLHAPSCPANPHPGQWTCPACQAHTGGTARARRALRRRCAHQHPDPYPPPPHTRPRGAPITAPSSPGPVMHRPAPSAMDHNPDTDQTKPYRLDDDEARVAQILGHDVHRRGHVRLTPAQRAQIAELVGWAKLQRCHSSRPSVSRRSERDLPDLPVTPRDDPTMREAI